MAIKQDSISADKAPIREQVEAARAAMAGKFNDRISQLEAMRKEVQSEIDGLTLIREFEATKSAFLREKGQFESMATEQLATIKRQTAELEARQVALTSAEAEVKVKSAQLTRDIAEQKAAAAKALSEHTAVMAKLAEERKHVVAETARLTSLSESLNAKEVALAQKAEKLRTVISGG